MADGPGFRELPLPEGVSGKLYLSSMPGRYRPFEQDLAEAESRGVRTVLCLNPRDEVRHKSPLYHRALNDGSHGWRVVEHPVEDFRAPARDEGFLALVAAVVAELKGGVNVMLHCAGGIGRTGTVATCILIGLGLPAPEALARVRAAGAWPENQAQADFVRWFEAANSAASALPPETDHSRP